MLPLGPAITRNILPPAESFRGAAKRGALRGDVDDARGIDVTVGEAAGATRELDALGVVGVGREKPRETVAELADRGDAAETDLVAGARADGRADGAGVVENIFRADRELHRAEKIVEREVAQEIGGEDGDRAAQAVGPSVCG